MIRVAIVGTGGISHAHIKAYLQFPDRCRIAALVDIIPGKAQRVKEQYGLETNLITGIGSVIGAHSGPGTLALFFRGKERLIQ